MSRDINDILKDIVQQNKELNKTDDLLSKDVGDLKKIIRSIDTKIKSIDDKLSQMIDIMNSIAIFLVEEAEMNENVSEYEEEDSDEDWNPYESGIDYDDSDNY
jgi:hypothetical protein